MTKKLDSEGLRAIVDEYDLFFIDIWGVVHDGIKIHEEAIKTLDIIEKAKKDYLLITNAPRQNAPQQNATQQKATQQNALLARGGARAHVHAVRQVSSCACVV